MRLAEALQERADLNRKIEQLRTRLRNNAVVQEGEKPLEDPVELKTELDSCIERLSYLISRINHTNCQIMVEGKTLTEMIAQKDTLLLQISVYRDIIGSASHLVERVRMSEIKILPAVSVVDLQTEVDSLAAKMRRIENKLQEINWTRDLIE